MNKAPIAAVLALAGLAAFSSAALADEALAKKKGCMACHRLDRKLIGPAYKEVAQKYSQKDVGMLVDRIMNGSSGVWGPVMMVPNKGITKEEATQLVEWILSLK
jgi:cytochrome c